MFPPAYLRSRRRSIARIRRRPKQRERQKQHADEIKCVVVQHAVQNALALQKHHQNINCRQREPRAVGEIIDAVNRRIPLVLDGLHPKHAARKPSSARARRRPSRNETASCRLQSGVAGHVLPQRPVIDARGHQPPDAEKNRRRDPKSGNGEHRPFDGDQTAVRIKRHPRINFLAQRLRRAKTKSPATETAAKRGAR